MDVNSINMVYCCFAYGKNRALQFGGVVIDYFCSNYKELMLEFRCSTTKRTYLNYLK